MYTQVTLLLLLLLLHLTDKRVPRYEKCIFAILREIGVDTGGSNVQFSICPNTGRMIVIEMNPRVSRSSALASKATGYPIAKVATLLAVGFTLMKFKMILLELLLYLLSQ